MAFFRKNCYYCKFCYKEKKEVAIKEQITLEAVEETSEAPKRSDLTPEDLSDMYGLRQVYHVKCFKGQWDEEQNPELKLQSLKNRTCKYFISRKKNRNKTHEQVEKEQMERASSKMHRQTIEWMQISFLLGIISILIGLMHKMPDVVTRVVDFSK